MRKRYHTRELDGIIFDCDGTIIDSLQSTYGWFEHICARYEKHFPFTSPQEFKQETSTLQFIPRGKQSKKSSLYESLGFEWTAQTKALLEKEYNSYKRTHSIPFVDGMDSLIRDLFMQSRPHLGRIRGLRLALLTNNSWDGIASSMEPLRPYFDTIHTNEHLHKDFEGNIMTKPHKLPMMQTVSVLGLHAPYLVHVGDTPDDKLASEDLLLHHPDKVQSVEFIAVTWGFGTRKALERVNPRYMVDSPQELDSLLRKLGACRR